MTTKKYQVFVSSTFRDLVDERQDAIRNILDLKHIPAGMELFPAADIDQLVYIKKVIDECDYYLLIMGGRYGSMDADGISYTEREYDYAVTTGKVVLAFVHGDPESISLAKSDVKPEIVITLNAFRAKVMTGRLVRSWTTRQNLEPLVLKALIHTFSDMPQVGWIRGDAAAKEALIEQSNKILQENMQLKSEIFELRKDKTIDIDNIADLADIFEIRYITREKRGRVHDDVSRTIKLSWHKIFLSLAGNLEKPKTNKIIFTGLKDSITENYRNYNIISINDVDKIRVKVQFIALGLIRSQVSKTTTGGIEEFILLTSKGRTIFMEGMILRKAE